MAAARAGHGPAGEEANALDVHPSGDQFEITWRDQRAVVVEVGGGIRRYDVGERAVLDPYSEDAMCDGGHGTPLIPWPNRLADGRYRFDGTDYQVAVTEPAKQNAIHGLLRWRPWQAAERRPDRITMTARLFPMEGYPFLVDVAVTYALGRDGLTVTTRAANLGRGPCPFGAGQHPYLSSGSATLDVCTLQLDAATRIVTDGPRQLPSGTEPVAGGAYDFRSPRTLGDQRIDCPFTDLARDEDGRAWARLRGPDGRTAALWVDGHWPLIEVYTGDTLAVGRRRRGLGAEPMTCPPDAFRTGEGVIRLEPGAAVTMQWGVVLS